MANKDERKVTWRRDAAKASWELFRRVLNWEQMLLASLAALRLSMASWATLRFHSGVMAGGFTNVILWMIWEREEEEVLQRAQHGLHLLWPAGLDAAHLFDLLPEEPGDRGSRVKRDLHVIGSV